MSSEPLLLPQLPLPAIYLALRAELSDEKWSPWGEMDFHFWGASCQFSQGWGWGPRTSLAYGEMPAETSWVCIHANGDKPGDHSLHHPVGAPAALEGEKTPSSAAFPSHPSHSPSVLLRGARPLSHPQRKQPLSSPQRHGVPQLPSEETAPQLPSEARGP